MPRRYRDLRDLAPWQSDVCSETAPVDANVFSDPGGNLSLRYDMHCELEVGVVLSGRVRRLYQETSLDLGPGQVWFCGTGEPHGWQVTQAPGARLVFMIWPPLLANSFYSECPRFPWMAPFSLPVDQRPQPKGARRDTVLALARRIGQGTDGSDATRALWLRLLTMELLLVLLEAHPCPAAVPAPGPEAYHRITPALKMAFDARRFVTNDEAAKACGLSQGRFVRLFQHLMGVSFAKLSLRHRLRGAAQELREGDAPLKTIAREWGFTDKTHLGRVFKLHYGRTPGSFRREFHGMGPDSEFS